MDPITLDQLAGVRRNGPTDPIDYYRRPGVGALFRKRINLGLAMLPPRRFSRALEVGYGSGSVLLSLAKGVDDLHGLDLDAEPKSVCEMLISRGCRANLVQGTVHNLPYDDGHFELIVSFSVFEHLKDYETALREVRRVLAPEGLFLLGMPAVNRLMSLMFEAIGHRTIDDIHVTTPRMISRAFASNGFRVVRANPLNLPFSPPFGLSLYHNWLLEKDGA
jgi:ubiquinone/menaquinone biosynthesis C-methylase UbiE